MLCCSFTGLYFSDKNQFLIMSSKLDCDKSSSSSNIGNEMETNNKGD